MRVPFQLGLLAMLVPSLLQAAESYPQAAVVFEVRVGTLTGSDLGPFRSAIRERLLQAAHKYFRCLEWVPGEPGSTVPGARLLVELLGRSYGKDLQIDLTFRGAVDEGEPVDLWIERSVSSTLDTSWTPRNPMGLQQEVFRTVDALFKAEPFRSRVDSLFIAKVPIAKSIEVVSSGQEIIVPINPYRLNVVDSSPLDLRLVATMCHHTPEYCRIELTSRGPGFGKFQDQLQCGVEYTACCNRRGWQSELPGWLATRKRETVRVFLGEKHQDCLYGYQNCPDRYRTFREPGFE